MKKITLFITLFLVISVYSYAQSLVFMQNGNAINNNETIIYSTVDMYGNMDPHVIVKNQSESSISATLTVTVMEEPIGGFVGYCGWGFSSCVPVSYGTPLGSTTTIQNGEEIDPMIEAMGIVEGENVNIKAEYKLTYANEERTVVVHFLIDPTSIDNSSVQDREIQILNSELVYNFNSTGVRQLAIYNVMGTVVSSEYISDESGVIDLSILNKGVYIYSLIENNQTITSHKFVVR